MAQRVSQVPLEAALLPTTSTLTRASQTALEAAVFATSTLSRASQTALEAAVFTTSELARASQVVLEVVVLPGQPGYPRGYW